MYKYSDKDKKIIASRVKQFENQVKRRLEGKLTEEEFSWFLKNDHPRLLKLYDSYTQQLPELDNVCTKTADLREIFDDYEESILNGFIDYWTEPNKSNTKMKYELNKTWETKRRLKTWANNQKKWDKPKTKTMSKLDAQINAWQEAKKLL